MKFDFIIGNPPYQDESNGEMRNYARNYAPPIYDKFMDACYGVADTVELIHPARFLFNAGSTPKAWNEKCCTMSILRFFITRRMEIKYPVFGSFRQPRKRLRKRKPAILQFKSDMVNF